MLRAEFRKPVPQRRKTGFGQAEDIERALRLCMCVEVNRVLLRPILRKPATAGFAPCEQR